MAYDDDCDNEPEDENELLNEYVIETEDNYDPRDETERARGGRATTKVQKLSLGLFLDSNPVRSRRFDENEIGLHRRVLCRRYTNCLAHAAQQDWLGWSCN